MGFNQTVLEAFFRLCKVCLPYFIKERYIFLQPIAAFKANFLFKLMYIL